MTPKTRAKHGTPYLRNIEHRRPPKTQYRDHRSFPWLPHLRSYQESKLSIEKFLKLHKLPINPRTFRSRLTQYRNGAFKGLEDSSTIPDLRGRCHTTMTKDQEDILADMFKDRIYSNQGLSHSQMATMSRDFYSEYIAPLSPPGEASKFSASTSWIIKMQKRYSLSFGSPHITKHAPPTQAEMDTAFQYCLDIHEAVANLGAARVLCMDETSVRFTPTPGKYVHIKGEPKRHIFLPGDEKKCLTMVCTIGFDGKLFIPYFLKTGKTKKAVSNESNALERIGVDLSQLSIAYSPSGWMTSDLMISFLFGLSLKMQKQPFALVMDHYPGHMTTAVLEHAEKLRIQLIFVPKKRTGQLSPLDVGIFGPFKKKVNASMIRWRLNNPGQEINYSQCTKFATEAWHSLTPENVVSAWTKAMKGDLLEKLLD